MILRILIIACAVFICPSLGKLDEVGFRHFENECFFQGRDNERFEVNGQEIPLSSTLENFISFAEKFEQANPGIGLQEELEYFISDYLFENIKFTDRSVVPYNDWARTDFTHIEGFWNPQKSDASRVDPFTPDEKCSLYYMISHSILAKYGGLQKSRPRVFSTGNTSSLDRGLMRGEMRELNVDDYFPQELGVVAIRGTDAAVSLSKVLLGLYVGLKNNNRMAQVSSFTGVNDKFSNAEIEGKRMSDLSVDQLYAVTMADVLMKAYWYPQDQGRKTLAPNGQWISTFLGETDFRIERFCPMAYVQKSVEDTTILPLYSYSSVRGAADGLILGLTIPKVLEKQSKAKLSQILRMYYSADGITVFDPIEDIQDKRVSFCKRRQLMQKVWEKAKEQLLSYGFLIGKLKEDINFTYHAAYTKYESEENDIFNNVNTEIQEYCMKQPSDPKIEDFPKEPLLDIIVVMDSANEPSSFEQQQFIVGYLAKYLDLRYTGSRMTVLLDQRNSTVSSVSRTDSGSPRIILDSILADTYSSSCVACIVAQYVSSDTSSALRKEDVIIALNQLLQERKESEKESSGVNGKVVIFFNFEPNMNGGNKKLDASLESALRDFHLNHQDIAFYAVGLHKELLKRYARNDNSLTVARPDVAPEDVAKELFKKISSEPALLQYEDCLEGRNEKAAFYESFVSPNTITHYEMPAKYMNASKTITFTFETPNGGYINVCHNRASKDAEYESRNCKNTTGNAAVEFKVTSPCKNFDRYSCAPIWFSIMGTNQNNGEMKRDNNRVRNYCEDIRGSKENKWCRTLDQIKFRVSHDGVRCSGCLVTPQIVVLFTALLTYFMCKRL